MRSRKSNQLRADRLRGRLRGPAETGAAYVRTTTSTGIPIAWKAPGVKIEFSLGDTPPELGPRDILMPPRRQARLGAIPRSTGSIAAPT